MRPRVSFPLSFLALCGLFAGTPADAAVMLLRVGADAACEYRTDVLPNALQSAINAVPTALSPGDSYVIRVARNGNYSGRNYSLLNRSLVIEGGYATCASATPDSTNTEIDAAGAVAGPALDIHGGAMRRNIVLQRLTVKNSDGGGLLVRMADVRLERVTVSNNNATNGGGIALSGSAIVRLSGNSAVTSNTATGSGGGIHCSNDGLLWLESASAVISNTAMVYGGGILLDQCNGIVNSGATGLAGLFVNIGFNEAALGGGIAVLSSGSGPQAALTIGRDLTGSDPRPLIVSNQASNQGGGIYAAGPRAYVDIYDATIGSNTATSIGGGIMARNGAWVTVSRTHRQCAGSQECSRIVNNEANWGGGVGAAGENTRVRVNGTRLEGNQASAGGSAYYAAQGGAEQWSVWSANNVITGNTGASAVEISPDAAIAPRQASVVLFSDTLAGNSGGAAVINANAEGRVMLMHTLIHTESALPALRRTGDPVEPQAQMRCNIFHSPVGVTDRDPLTSIYAVPGFIDAAGGNYRLRADAWAIDQCPHPEGFVLDRDHDLNPRPVNSPLGDIHGPYDVGAYEWNPILFQDGFEG